MNKPWIAATGAGIGLMVAIASRPAVAQDAPAQPPPAPSAPADAQLPPPAAAGTESVAPAPTAEGGAEAASAESKEGEKEEVGEVRLDFVVGQGDVPFVFQFPPAGNGQLGGNGVGVTKTTALSFILSTEFKIASGFGAEVRLPWIDGHISPPSDGSEGPSNWFSAMGNIEVAGFFETKLMKDLSGLAAIGFALPTAQGTEGPEATEDPNSTKFDRSANNQMAVQRAAAASRGWEDNALFEPHRVGIVPKIGVKWTHEKLALEPYIKIENLIATNDTLAHKYVGEFVGAVRGSYRAHENIEPALRMWTAIAFSGSDEDKKATFFVEPQVVGHFGPVHPVLGLILPVAGALTDPRYLAVRAAIAASF